MEKLLKRLKSVLEKQIQLLEIVKTIEKSKNDVLAEGKLMDFTEINENLSKLIEENNKLDKEREKTMRDISSMIDIEHKENISLQDINQYIDNKATKKELDKMHQTLKETVSDIKYFSKINQELIEVIIQVIDISLNQEQLSDKDIDYTHKVKSNKERPLLINKII